MTHLLTVQDPDEGASAEATETRRLLHDWAERHLPAGDTNAIEALDDDTIKALRERGVASLRRAADMLVQTPAKFNPPTLFGKLLGEFSCATQYVTDEFPVDSNPRGLSHAFEGLVREFNKQFFQAGMKWNLHAEYLAVLALHAPHRTSREQDMVFQAHCRNLNIIGGSPSNTIGVRHDDEWYNAWERIGAQTGERFAPLVDWAISQHGGVVIGSEGKDYWARKLTRIGYVGTQIHYMDEDGPWVAGFLNLDDACKMRFRRIRLGAYLTEQGMSDASVRARVERAKQLVAGAKFRAYPNDTQWEYVYTHGPSSCMADSADDYECWDGLHPVDAYSSSYHGSGDNSLCLLTSEDEDGNVTGRGILNLRKDTIIRWYGDNVAERVLLRQGVNTSDRGNMEGAWLALLQKGKKFIHPYVDGDLSYGRVEGDRVYIVDDGDHPCIQETSGSSYMSDTKWCIDTGDYEAEEDCTHQPITDTYISDNCDNWRCPVIGEYANPGERTTMDLHGVSVEVSDHAYYQRGQYLTAIGNIRGSISSHRGPWSIDDDHMRAEFFEYHGIEEDEPEDEDEEAA